jgi:alanyl-tRNA synthetase
MPVSTCLAGMGFERVTAVIQNKASNYDTDVFNPLMDAIGRLTGKRYGGKLDDRHDIGFRVIADHARMATFAITDGARPGNKKRDAVLRSVIRRAVRFGYQYFELREPFVFKLVPVLVEHMGAAFPGLKEDPKKVADILRAEEAEFLNTIQRGLAHFEGAVSRGKQVGLISGEDAADLHTTYGFPVDLAAQMAAEVGMSVDLAEYEAAMERHRAVSGQGREKVIITAVSGELPKTDDSAKYDGLKASAKLVGWVKDNAVVLKGAVKEGEKVALLLDRTNFYGEQGGQVGDRGIIETDTGRFTVMDTQRLGEAILHVGEVRVGHLEVGQSARLELLGDVRLPTMRNHTATHLLNWALRRVLGDHVDQKGSLVDAEKTRFDFSHDKPLSPDEVAHVEALVNDRIYEDLPVTAVTMPLADAKKLPGVRAMFGEKYPDPVRVLLIGSTKPHQATAKDSIEFCGGTHISHTRQIEFFKIASQEGVAKGVRRVTAITGRKVMDEVERLYRLVGNLSGRLNCKPEEILSRVEALQEEVKKLQTQLKKGLAGDLNSAADKLLADAVEANGAKIIVGELPAAPPEQMRAQVDRLRTKAKSAVVCLGWVEDGKVKLLAGVTDDLTKKVEAGKLIGEMAKVVGGNGGGRKDMAQAGGNDPSKLGEALALAKKTAQEKLS